jgi:hypothetical protein
MEVTKTISVSDNMSQVDLSKQYNAHVWAGIGSSVGLIYGVVTKKRWWVVLLLMAGGAGLGRGVGYVIKK